MELEKKYIDAEKLLVKIKGLYHEQGFETGEAEGAYQIAIKDILVIVTSLQQEQQQSAWSEEDENLLKLSLDNLTELINRFGEKYGAVGDCIDWLKSIKKRLKGDTK